MFECEVNPGNVSQADIVVGLVSYVSRQQKWHRMRHLVKGEAQVFSCMQEKT